MKLHSRHQQITAFSSAKISWYRQLASRIAAHWLLKATGTTAFMFVFFIGYMHLLRNPVFPVTVMPVTLLDSLVAFEPKAVFLYLSLWFYVSLPPALLGNREELFSFGWHIGGLCLAGMACFLFWPTAVPPIDVDWQSLAGFSVLKGVDAAGNACPSLHVATAIFSGVWLDRLFHETDSPCFVRLFNWAWCLGIVYSTLAIKQHVALDMAAGTVLGLSVAALSLALRPKAVAVPVS